MSLAEPIARWVRYQQELGMDEVIFDAPLVLPAANTNAPSSRRENAPPPSPIRPTAPVRPVGPPVAPTPAPVQRAAPPATKTVTPPPPPRAVPAPPPARTAIPVFSNLAELTTHAKSCTRCVLSRRRRSVLASGGPETSTWAILTLYAWGEDAERGEVLAGEYGKALLQLAAEAGLPKPAVAAIFACTPDDPADTTIQGFTEAVRCRGHWLQRLKLSNAKAVLVLDHKATQLARGPQGSVSWPAFRGERWELDGIPAISTHHPSRLARQAALEPEVKADLAIIRQILEGRS
ncbi:MAG: hypothetical protein IPK50_18560 [Fibrobacterota bacterium]|nr:hypothetical protein [Fibrobacterota bacterium]QQS04272.1 MAG: hypothetical protein IPK50_18560 [Fibrobacterota bacterium]